MKKILIILFISILVNSCHDNSSATNCQETKITMLINGEQHTFQALGRGINLTDNGYKLDLSFYKSTTIPFSQHNITLVLRYKKKGNNIIENFMYQQNVNGVNFDGDFVTGELNSKVISNNKSCFYATFSGKLNDGSQEITITDGIISYEYEEPFDN